MIYIVRHGQTDWNKEGRYQGKIDIELNELGVNQAETLRDKLENIDFDIVFSSTLKRAYKTAQIITNKKIIIDDRLSERGNGILEGKLKSEIKEVIDFNGSMASQYKIEDINDFKNRIKSFLDEIMVKYKNKNILIVTHAGVSIYIRCYFEGEPMDGDYSKYKLKNCEVIQYSND